MVVDTDRKLSLSDKTRLKCGRLIVVLAVTVLTACGGNEQSDNTAQTTSASGAGATIATTLNLDLQSQPNYAAPTLPSYYDAAVLSSDNTPAAEPLTDAIATVGRVLFYDRNLSANNTVSCASCHQQAFGFDDPDRFSVGLTGAIIGPAHAMRLGNLRYYEPGTAFWNQRAATIEDQVITPIVHPLELGFDASNGGIASLLQKLQALPYYQELFAIAFADGAVTEVRIRTALAQFLRSIVSVNSRWDSAYATVFDPALRDKGLGSPLPGLTAEEDRGRALFMAGPQQGGMGCRGCHVPPTFALAANSLGNGLDAGETIVFKSPSLKNVGASRAFMHDGRFSTLEQVVEHYDSGVQPGPAVDDSLIGPGGLPRQFNLAASDKAALVAFLLTLNDSELAADPKFSDPFKH